MMCRYESKRRYASEPLAIQGAQDIREKVETAGRRYDTLYPYPCPDDNHWHLSHHEQGEISCPACRESAPAWKLADSGSWIIAAHPPTGTRCVGVGASVEVRVGH